MSGTGDGGRGLLAGTGLIRMGAGVRRRRDEAGCVEDTKTFSRAIRPGAPDGQFRFWSCSERMRSSAGHRGRARGTWAQTYRSDVQCWVLPGAGESTTDR